mgnify:CR=1 FL=1
MFCCLRVANPTPLGCSILKSLLLSRFRTYRFWEMAWTQKSASGWCLAALCFGSRYSSSSSPPNSHWSRPSSCQIISTWTLKKNLNRSIELLDCYCSYCYCSYLCQIHSLQRSPGILSANAQGFHPFPLPKKGCSLTFIAIYWLWVGHAQKSWRGLCCWHFQNFLS